MMLANHFARFPNLRVASVENGAEFLPDLFRKLRSQAKKMPGYFAEDPVDIFRRHVWVNPFWEDDLLTVVDQMGADRVIFGSDWPHIEALPAPARLPARDQAALATPTAGSCSTTTPSSSPRSVPALAPRAEDHLGLVDLGHQAALVVGHGRSRPRSWCCPRAAPWTSP